ncbi:class I SAM-dependent methyltransferase [Methanospirillum hungatei]|uniref:class I SAM-dependent methyltransferase n=1 Tax=Methanospirillum hungatei TaxID=2203 RepID=UPI0026F1889B|nr:class I SAM-dependent methyltransferase [Methanospirillum hungatei]MCA1916356.1 class I SAM-dependent methyltransferase [Methanospirillum hungatei]
MIDWAHIWKEQYEAGSRLKEVGDCASLWDSKERALEFLNMSRENPERIEQVLLRLPITPESRILDIGAGPGTLALPFAERAAHVTAVEPSPGMIEVMKDQIAELQVHNLTIVPKRWEDVDPSSDLTGRFDIIVASYSLGMPDISTAIDKMQAVSSGQIWLFWFAGTTPWERHMERLWPEIHKKSYSHGPKSDVLYNVLYQKGIYPNMTVHEMKYEKKYQSMDDAVSEMRRQIGCSDNYDPLIKEYLKDKIIMNGQSFIENGMTTRVCMWWDTNQFPKK